MTPRHPWRFVLAGSLSVLAACASSETQTSGQATLDLAPCPAEDGIADGLCTSLTVFEDRAAASGRTIDLRIVVLPALSGAAEPDPLFILAGGPGQAATELTPVIRGPLRDVNRDRDIVFVDQRGTGESNPLTCELDEEEEDDATFLLDPMADTVLLAESPGTFGAPVQYGAGSGQSSGTRR